MKIVATAFITPWIALVIACGGGGESGGDGDGDGDGLNAVDAGPGTAGAAQCDNGVDDDGDGLIDGFDPECVSPLDDREDSFATGIPGDNIDAFKQDCFFDGDSGHGNDGCLMHTCCLLAGECPEDLKPEQYDPADCVASQDCIDFCAPLTPPGCDCFGCCTICGDVGCFDVLINPAVAPDCNVANLADPTQCPPCNKVEDCGPGDCFPLECNLCPGQTPDDLPEECEENVCPGGLTVCGGDADCPDGQYCAVGCCINVVT
jgi:hypothetical protein